MTTNTSRIFLIGIWCNNSRRLFKILIPNQGAGEEALSCCTTVASCKSNTVWIIASPLRLCKTVPRARINYHSAVIRDESLLLSLAHRAYAAIEVTSLSDRVQILSSHVTHREFEL